MEPDLKSVSTNEWGIVGGAVVAFLGLFFHAYGVSYSSKVAGFGFSGSESVSGWHFAGLWLPTFLLLAAGALVAVRRLRGDLIPTLPVGTRVIVAGAAALATLIVLIRVLSYPSSHISGVSAGASFGSYLILIAMIVATVFAVLDFRASGEKLPSMPKTSDSDKSEA